MIHTLIMVAFWAVALPFAAWSVSLDISYGKDCFLYRTAMWAAWTGVSLGGSQGEDGRTERIDPPGLTFSCRTMCRTSIRRYCCR